MEVFVQPDELNLVPADADAEAEPSAAQHVEARRLLRHQHRLALRQDQHADGEADALRAAGQEAEQDERIVIRIGGGADAAPAMIRRRIDPEHMVRRDQIRIAETLGCLRVVANDCWSGADIDHRQ